jgi:STE24 endopeptidase
LAAEDLATRYAPHVSASDRLLWTLPVLATAVAGFPWLLRIIWRTSPLPEGPLRQRLRQVEQKLSVRTSDILVWHTDHAICNAAVAGILPICRYVFLTDLLLARMSEDEIAAIYGHELGHVRHRHALWRLLAVILPIVLWRAVAASWPPQSVAASAWLTQHGMSAAAQAGLLAILVAAAYGCLVFSWYCRALERQADLCGCLATGSAHSYSSALTTLSLLAHGKRRAQRAGWLHPSLPDRAGFVSQLAANPAEWAAFDRRMRRLALLLAVMVMALSVWPLILPLIR